MEFYKEYFGGSERLNDGKYAYKSALDRLNVDVKNNQQWRSEIKGYTIADITEGSRILVRWVGLSEMPFKEVEE